MKKLSKILVTAILSASMCVSGFLAVNTLKANTVADALPITMSQYASAIKTTGAGSSATYVENEAQVSAASSKFTGIKLSGDTGATFDLGTFDIGSSDWAGSATATAAGNNVSMLEFVFSPTKAINKATEDALYGYYVYFNFTQGDKTLSIRVHNYGHATEASGLSFFAKGENQSSMGGYRDTKGWQTGNVIKKKLKVSDAANMGLTLTADADTVATGYSAAPNMLYYDFNDKALYTPQKYVSSSTGLDTSLLIRDLDATGATNGNESAWAGFTKDGDKCLVDVSVSFERMDNDNTIIITKLGNTVFNANVESTISVKATSNALTNDTLSLADFLYFGKFGSNITIPADASVLEALTVKVGASEQDAQVVTDTTYTFTESTNVYYYEGETLLGVTAVTVSDEIGVNVDIIGGKAFYQRGTEEKVEITSTTKIKIGDVITFEGGKHDVTGDDIEDIKVLNIAGNDIATLTGNTATAINGYSYVVIVDDIRGKSSLDLTAVLDNYCDVTFVDEYDGETTVYGWQSDIGCVQFPYLGIYNGDYRFYGASQGEKVLIGYGRDDGYTLKADGTIESWGYMDGSEKSAFYRVNGSNTKALNKDSNDGNATLDTFECITKGMKFTALYVGVEVYTAINSTTGELNIIADFNQEDCMRWQYYTHLRSDYHAKISIRYSIVTDTSYDVLDAAYNKDNDIKFSKNEADKTADDKKANVKNVGYKYNTDAYQITGSNVQKIGGLCRVTLPIDITLNEGEYLAYGAVATLQTAQGGATCNASQTYYMTNTEYNDKVIASNVIATGDLYSDNAGNGYFYKVNVGGVAKYSKYTVADLQKLYAKAEDTTVIA